MDLPLAPSVDVWWDLRRIRQCRHDPQYGNGTHRRKLQLFESRAVSWTVGANSQQQQQPRRQAGSQLHAEQDTRDRRGVSALGTWATPIVAYADA